MSYLEKILRTYQLFSSLQILETDNLKYIKTLLKEQHILNVRKKTKNTKTEKVIKQRLHRKRNIETQHFR